MAAEPQYEREDFITALIEAKGNLSLAAQNMGCTRQTVYNAMKRWETVKEAREEGRESMKDFAESKLFQNISKGKEASIFFYLKTQAKDRGYIERHEHAGVKDQPIGVSITYVNHWRDNEGD